MKYAYVRFLKDEVIIPARLEAVIEEGYDVLYSNNQKDNLFNDIKKGDILVIWNISCLVDSINECIKDLGVLLEKKVHIKILAAGIDTRDNSGDFIPHMIAFLRDLHCGLIKSRMDSMKRKYSHMGKKGGRKNKFTKKHEKKIIKDYQSDKYSSQQIADKYLIAVPTIYNILKRHNMRARQFAENYHD